MGRSEPAKGDDEVCTCPCLDCVEGRHCGGAYAVDGIVVGECEVMLPYDWDHESDEDDEE